MRIVKYGNPILECTVEVNSPHRVQPIDCPERNSSIATKIYLDISTRFLKCFSAKSVLSNNSDTYLHVTTCHQLLDGVSLVNYQSRNIDSRFRNDFGALEPPAFATCW